jgi:hypothetical protein
MQAMLDGNRERLPNWKCPRMDFKKIPSVRLDDMATLSEMACSGLLATLGC